MTADRTTATLSYQEILSQVASAYQQQIKGVTKTPRPAAASVVDALLEAEKAAKQARLVYPLKALLGQWRLCFTTGTRKRQQSGIALGKGFYLPRFTPAYIGFHADERAIESESNPAEISNQIQIGSVQLKLIGPAKYIAKKNLLAFYFTQLQLRLFERQIFSRGFRGGEAKTAAFANQSIGQLPFFAFFLMTEDFIAARGRGGGLAVWIRDR
ncbi:MAG TPA: hypothetical protein V6D10_23045 [Trichocoleus sp.]|jgi:hypothetical protein